MKTTTTWHDANGFPHDLPYEVTFTLEESDTWICRECDLDVDSDVDDAGHRYDGPTAEQIWTACPMEGDGDGDVFTGSFKDALEFFTDSMGTHIPENDEERANLALLYLEQGETEEAQQTVNASSLLETLEEIYLNGFADDVTGDVEAPCGHAYRVARSVVVTDSQGFKEDYHFPTVADAQDFFHGIEHEYGTWLGEEDD